MSSEVKVYFALDGDDFEPDKITEVLELVPSEVLRKESKMNGRLPKISSWQIEAELNQGAQHDVFDMASTLVNILEPKKALIVKLIDRFKLTPRLEVVVWISCDENESTPPIGFYKETIAFLGEIGAYIDVDTYTL